MFYVLQASKKISKGVPLSLPMSSTNKDVLCQRGEKISKNNDSLFLLFGEAIYMALADYLALWQII